MVRMFVRHEVAERLQLRHPPELVTYLGQRNIAIFSTDMDSFDFKMRKPEQVVKSVMAKLKFPSTLTAHSPGRRGRMSRSSTVPEDTSS